MIRAPWLRSADSKMICADFPPNSKLTCPNIVGMSRKSKRPSALRMYDIHKIRDVLTFLRLLFAAASMILRPVAVLPVNATLSTSGWEVRAAPPIDPKDATVLTTPGGNLYNDEYPAWFLNSQFKRYAYPASTISSESF